MPPINIYKCSQCDVIFNKGWGGYQYVEDDKGERICCPHPIEDLRICEVLGISYYAIDGISDDDYMSNNFNRRDLLTPIPIGNPPKPAWWWSKKRRAKFEERRANRDKIKSFIQSRTGYNSNCVCQDCLAHIYLDLGDAEESEQSWRSYYEAFYRKDERLCPHCGSRNVRSVMELIGHICPHCKHGTVIEVITGEIS